MDKQLVTEGQYLTVFVPATSKALVFRVRSVVNRDYPSFAYGSLPLSSGDTLSNYDGGSTSVPADGVIPARGYNGEGKTFPLNGVYDDSDMWFVPSDYRERVFHVIQHVTPAFLRVDVQIPVAVTQGQFQRRQLVTGVQANFGFARGTLETIHFPELHYGFRYGNDSNLSLLTEVEFTYGEYIIEIPKDPELIFSILTRKVPSHWTSLPVAAYDPTISEALTDDYGIEGFELYPVPQKDKAISEYQKLLEEAKI